MTEPTEPMPEVVRSEEEVTLSTVTVPHARVRLRKEVVTEEVHLRVEVRREVLHVEQVPEDVPLALTPEQAQQLAVDHALGPGEQEIVLYSHVPVVHHVVVPRERVTLRREVVTEPASVTTERRVERVEVDER